jgi:hypothetical protein
MNIHAQASKMAAKNDSHKTDLVMAGMVKLPTQGLQKKCQTFKCKTIKNRSWAHEN